MSRSIFLLRDYKLNNQALIWVLIKRSQHEEVALTKKIAEYANSEYFIPYLAANEFHFTAALKGHEPQPESI